MRIGIDIGGSHISIGLINDANEIIEKIDRDIKISKSENPENVLINNVSELIEEMMFKTNCDEVSLIGVACPRNM